ncbi:TPA: hypothetical protein PC537_002848 [Morganella morganii]|nr:hypothetical protein [Morganella morganii]
MKELDKMFQLAKDIKYIFVENKDTLNDLGFPFFYSFPQNGCQSASVFLAIYFSQIFAEVDVYVVHGKTRGDEDCHHYWVEVNSKVYDITLDQFYPLLKDEYDGLEFPIYSGNKHPLSMYFFYKEREDITTAFSTYINKCANLNEVMNAFYFCYYELRKIGWFPDFFIKKDLM